jgi:hypothetical protein
MADDIFDRCAVYGVKLSFTSQAQLGAHPKTLERARAMPYSLSQAAAATGLTRR